MKFTLKNPKGSSPELIITPETTTEAFQLGLFFGSLEEFDFSMGMTDIYIPIKRSETIINKEAFLRD